MSELEPRRNLKEQVVFRGEMFDIVQAKQPDGKMQEERVALILLQWIKKEML